MDYGDIVYHQPSNDAFSNKLETVQYNSAWAITREIKGTSPKKLYPGLGLEYLQQKRWMKHLCLFYEVNSAKIPAYIYDFVLLLGQSQETSLKHLTPSLAELSISELIFFLGLSVNRAS